MNNSAIRYTFFIFSILLLGTSCGTIRFLEEDETLLRKNEIEFTDEESVDEMGSLKYELGNLAYQKPNSRFLVFPSFGPWWYYRMQSKNDTTKWTNFVNKNWVEEPSIYNIELADASAREMEKRMYKRGYFNAKVDFETKKIGLRKKKTKVTYFIDSGKRYYFDTVQYVSKDPQIQSTLRKIQNESFIKKGEPVDDRLFDQEKRRITNHLKNIGYANFFTNYFAPIQGDSIGQKVNAEIEILLPKDSSYHRRYRIGDIKVFSLFDERGDPIYGRDSLYKGIHYSVLKNKHYFKLKPINRKIFLEKGQIYNVDDLTKTRVQLGNLDLFQFVDVRRSGITNDSLIDYEIRLIPKKSQEFGVDFEINNANTNNPAATTNSFFGTSASLNYKNRNIFRGGEVFSLRAEGGLEVSPQGLRNFTLNSWNVNLNANLDFPRYYDFVRTDKWLFKFYGQGKKYRKLEEEGISILRANYSILSNTGNYRIDRVASSAGWRFKPNRYWEVSATKVGFDFLDRSFSQSFQENFVDRNPAFERSLRPQLLTAFGLLPPIFAKDINAIWKKDIGQSGKSSMFIRLNGEISGLEVYLFNLAGNIISDSQNVAKLFNKYEFSQFAKGEVDARFYRKLGGNRMFASRLNIGAAWNYGFSDEIPYVKQFFAGGPLSMRGWQIRELGPGSYLDPDLDDDTRSFYQTGDFKFEMNAEYRFDLLWYLKGALFVDMGNIWTLGTDQRPGSGISGFDDFLQEIAVGTGFGLRLDVDYFVISSDFGYKVRNPFPDKDGKHLVFRPLALNKFKWQLTVGYPF